MYLVSCCLNENQLLLELSASSTIFVRAGVLGPSFCCGLPSQHLQSIISLRFRTVQFLHSRCQYRLDSESINKFLQIAYYRVPYMYMSVCVGARAMWQSAERVLKRGSSESNHVAHFSHTQMQNL